MMMPCGVLEWKGVCAPLAGGGGVQWRSSGLRESRTGVFGGHEGIPAIPSFVVGMPFSFIVYQEHRNLNKYSSFVLIFCRYK